MNKDICLHMTTNMLGHSNIVAYHEYFPLAEGSHGWDNTWDRMHAVFLANGPAFRKGVSHEPINNVHIYPLMCTVLDIDCPPSDGSVDAVRDMFLLEDDDGFDMATVLTGT